MFENEIAHVVISVVKDIKVTPNRNEISEVKWIDFSELEQDMTNNPDNYAARFRKIIYISKVQS